MSQTVNTLDLDVAETYARRWRQLEGSYNKHHELHAFLIPKADLIEVLEEGVDAVRAYLGVDNDGVEKLMIVGTTLNSHTGIYEDIIPVGEEDNCIYDFTRPCPPTCDPSSPLNNV